MTLYIDRAAEIKLLARYDEASVAKVLKEAAKVGANAAQLIVKSAAPLGTSARLSQYYRANGLGHGTFRRSVRAAPIRSRPGIGYVIAPIGSKAFTRYWIERGTKHQRANPWFPADRAARSAADSSAAVLAHYAEQPV